MDSFIPDDEQQQQPIKDSFIEDSFIPDPEPIKDDDTGPLIPNRPRESFLSRALKSYNESPLTQPLTDIPSEFASSINEYIDPNQGQHPLAKLGRGVIQFIGDAASQLTAPLDLALAVASGGSNILAKQGMRTGANLLNKGAKALSVPVAAHGVGNVVNPESTLMERGLGALETVGGIAGFRQKINQPIPTAQETIKSKVISEADDLINGGKRILDLKDTAPTEFHLPPDWDSVDPYVKRLNELTDKFTNGTGTADELIEAQKINKIVRRIAPYDDPEVRMQLYKEKNYTPKEGSLQELAKPSKPKVRLHLDGSATDLNTGETIFPNKPTNKPIPVGSEPSLGPVEMQPNLTIKQPTLQNVSQAVKDGYKFTGQNPDGSYEFQHVGKIGTITDAKKSSNLDEAFNFPRAVMASMDMSAPLRQGLGLIHKKEFWTSLDDMFRSWGSEEAFRQVQDSIIKDSSGLFKPREFVNAKGVKVKKSIAEQSGLAIMDLTDLTSREELIASTWAEKIPGVRRSNRAYTAFLNKLRADTFKSLVHDAGIVVGDVNTNQALTKELANFVNTASGRGSLGKLEQSATALNRLFFSPRLIASRMQMLNPVYYAQASPQVRKEALKSLFAITAFGNTLTELSKLAGAEVENDPASSDFRKIRFGDVRVDPYGGFQQYAVLANRLITGDMKSSTSGKKYDLGDNKFGRSNRWDVASRFAESKLNPALTFAIDMMKGKDFTGQPFSVPNELAERLTPIIVQDLTQLASENPELLGGMADILAGKGTVENLPFAIPAAFGMGIQQYESSKRY